MKSDLTRSTFRREKHYSGVRMQQGRVQIDADWNEQVDIAAYLDETTRIDVIGRCGMPVHDAGFGVTVMPEGDDLALSPGRAYVGGIPCENDGTPIRILVIDDSELGLDGVVADGRELREGEWVELSATGVDPIWRRIEAVDVKSWAVRLEPMLDPAAQKALADAGDAGLRRLTTYLTQPSFPGDPSAASEMMPEEGLYLVYLDVWQRHRTALEDGSLREVALGGPDHATRTQTVWQVRRTLIGEEEATCESLPSWDVIAQGTTGRLRARAHPETTADDPCTIPPGAGFRRGENQLYRVEIVTSGELGTAEFTYSRENGSVVVPWLDSDNGSMTVTTIGRDAVLGFGPGDWVELTDDTLELAGETGTLARVKTANGKVLALHTGPPDPPTGSLDIADFKLNPKVRRWDDPEGKRTVEMAADNDGFLVLEDGVEVRFEDGHYRALDYWLIPARTALGDVEWAVDSAGTPLAAPPDGVAHHYCALALLRFDERWELVQDCRKLFPPLTEVSGAPTEEGVHVVKITTHESELQNDGLITPDQLTDGIEIHCDRDVDGATLRRKPTCLVTIDLPFPANEADRALWGDRVVGSMPVTLAADVSASGSTIRWRPAAETREWLSSRLMKVLEQVDVSEVLVHLLLRGRFVSEAGNPLVNVDGEAFGLLAGARLDVALPSGDGRRGGDLELWFWLRTADDGGHHAVAVLAVPTASNVLTSGASRSAVSNAISAVLPRVALLDALPAGFEVDLDAVPDPPRARDLLSRERLAEPDTTPTLVLAVEEALVGAAGVVAEALLEHDVPLGLEVTVVSSAAELADRLAGEQPPDLMLISQEFFDLLARGVPGSIAPEGTIPL